MPPSDDQILFLTAQIVSAHIERNDIPAKALPGLIRDVYQALAGVTPGVAAVSPKMAAPAPRRAVSGQSVFDDHLVCEECGLSMKMLKRHLQTVHGLSPQQYRSKFQLPGDYPMVTRHYAALRSNLAKESGLGKRPQPRGR